MASGRRPERVAFTASRCPFAKKMGAKGAKNRAKLPRCVQARIAQMYADPDGEAVKVGYHLATTRSERLSDCE